MDRRRINAMSLALIGGSVLLIGGLELDRVQPAVEISPVAVTEPAPAVTSATGAANSSLLPSTVPAADPAVTQSSIDSTICVPGYTARVRPSTSVTGPIKARLEAGRNIDAELDHAIPLELGGWSGRDGRNLWLEPEPRARAVDQIENSLHRAVCAKEISLTAAQSQIVAVKEQQG